MLTLRLIYINICHLGWLGHSLLPTLVATCALTLKVIVTYIFKDGSLFGYSIIWWNGLFDFGCGFLITWGYYFSGKWQKVKSLAV